MTNTATLSYTGRLDLPTDETGQLTTDAQATLHTLLDDAIAGYHGDSVTLETAVVHFERTETFSADGMPRAHVELSADGPLAELTGLEDTLAQTVVDMGFEPDTSTAKDSITLS